MRAFAYKEFVRLRMKLVWLTGIVALAATVGSLLGGIHINADSGVHVGTIHNGVTSSPGMGLSVTTGAKAWHGVGVEFAAVALTAGLVAAIFASIVGSSLARERRFAEFAWTMPVERWRAALAVIGVDLAAITAAYAIVMVVGELLPITAMHLWKYVIFGEHAWMVVALNLLFPFALYGLVQAASASMRSGYTAPGGLIWPVMWTLALVSTSPLQSVLVQAARGLNDASPMHYYRPDAPDLAALAGLAVVGCVAAVAQWQRLEA